MISETAKNDLINDIHNCIQEGDYFSALEIANNILNYLPNDTELLNIKFLSEQKLDLLAELHETSERLLEADPSNSQALTFRGNFLVEEGYLREGFDLLEIAGLSLFQKDQFDEAFAIWDYICSYDSPARIRNWINLVWRHQSLLEEATQKKIWSIVCDMNEKEDYFVVEVQANVCYHNKDSDKALILYKKSYDLGHRSDRIFYLIGMILTFQEKYTEALHWLKQSTSPEFEKEVKYWTGLSIINTGLGTQKDVNDYFSLWASDFKKSCLPRPALPQKQYPLRLGFSSFAMANSPFFAQTFPKFALSLVNKGVDVFLYSLSEVGPEKVNTKYVFRHLADLSWEEKSSVIKEDNLHVLFDCDFIASGFSIELHRYGPAPITMSYIHGMSSFHGLTDAIILDDTLCPQEYNEIFHEEIIRVKETIIYIEPDAKCADIEPPPCLKNGYITFGSFNRASKIEQDTVSLWASVLKAIPNSRIFMRSKTFSDYEIDRVRKLFEEHDISFDRITIKGQTTFDDFMASYAAIDIALDPFHFNGGLTTAETLWQGIPVVTLPGHLVIGRMSSSILQSIGHPEWIARDAEDWLRIVTNLAADWDGLSRIRQSMRQHMMDSAICNPDRAAANFLAAIQPFVERAYQRQAQGRS